MAKLKKRSERRLMLMPEHYDDMERTDGDESESSRSSAEAPREDICCSITSLQDHFRVLQANIVDEVRRAIREEFDDFRVAMATPPGSPTPGSPQPTASFEAQFKAFAKFGDSKSTGEAITLSNSDKWFKQGKVIDGKKITTTDTGIYFKQVAKTKKALAIKDYEQFLQIIGKNKKVEVEDIKQKLRTCGPPATTRTTPVATGGAVARLTDHTKYTGTHKQRFDDTGKGKGKDGREDPPDESGYVTGYKDQGNYDKTH
ncbi:tubulin polymerization-promoting protein homolog isoform X2 [Ornithodoros turicata]|uniref:tubulin polymerization-promoting protein homolog isoform X2 n=1 Tax=Ornithodoros turicata TaxID=34597 RepID=UPI003139247B